jgi:hypothetical protein
MLHYLPLFYLFQVVIQTTDHDAPVAGSWLTRITSSLHATMHEAPGEAHNTNHVAALSVQGPIEALKWTLVSRLSTTLKPTASQNLSDTSS